MEVPLLSEFSIPRSYNHRQHHHPVHYCTYWSGMATVRELNYCGKSSSSTILVVHSRNERKYSEIVIWEAKAFVPSRSSCTAIVDGRMAGKHQALLYINGRRNGHIKQPIFSLLSLAHMRHIYCHISSSYLSFSHSFLLPPSSSESNKNESLMFIISSSV